MSRIQYPLDFFTRDEAMRMAALTVEAGVTCIEAGHLLIKILGVGIVTELREEFDGIDVVADMKTMDMGAEEVRVAADAGATEVIICAAAGDGAVAAAVAEADRRQVNLMCSLMGIRNRVDRSAQLAGLGVREVIAHRGFDDSFRWQEPEQWAELGKLLELPAPKVAVAGGLDIDAVRQLAKLDVGRIVVGTVINNADDPSAAARTVVEAARG